MIRVTNTDVVKAMTTAYEEKTKRAVAVFAGTWEKTLDQFEKSPETMNPSTIEKIADYFGFDVEMTFIKRVENNDADKKIS